MCTLRNGCAPWVTETWKLLRDLGRALEAAINGLRRKLHTVYSVLQAEWHPSRVMDDLQSQNLAMDMSDSSPTLTNNRLENGMAQLITTEAWNINSTDLVKKALVTVPAPSILNPPAESQSGVALKVAATVLQPLCLDPVLHNKRGHAIRSPWTATKSSPCSS